ncbi:MAG: hypothetical protein ACTSRW_01110 [Candidatus Helarchaeota archaeon]
MPLTWRTRLLILVVVASSAIGAALLNQALILIELPGDPNAKEAYFFQTNRFATYLYEDGTYGHQITLTVQSLLENATHAHVRILISGAEQGDFYVEPITGIVYQNGVLDNNYSIWWIYAPNPMLSLGQGLVLGTTYNVIDPTGFLGIVDRTYTMIVEQKHVYWPHDQALWFILGAQASFDVGLYDKTNNKRISTATLDLTCGVIELWEGAQSNQIKMTLTITDFPISRNRINILPWVFIFGAVLCAVSYLLMRKKWENKTLALMNIEPEKRNEVAILMIAGVGAIAIEFVDIWFYAPLGLGGNLLLHLGYVLGLAVIIYKYKYGFRWLTPAILEILFVGAINLITNDPYVPHLTAFMGSMISWICLLFVSGYERNFDEGNNIVQKIISKFI